jgi:molybdopterin-guanine dinucleotide biosynthesis protein MobB
MRIIHVAGLSGSGKTTFIRSLIPELAQLGPVAAVKHIGHHSWTLEEGKDTTFFLHAGAYQSVGIDPEKTVSVIHETDLGRTLRMLCDMGIRYAVVEGFKSKPFPKVLIGSLPGATGVILENPDIMDVIASIASFTEYYTLGGMIMEMQAETSRAPGCVYASFCAGITGASETPSSAGEIYRIFLETFMKKSVEKSRILAGRSYFGPDLPGGSDKVLRIAVQAPSLIKGTTFIHDLVQRFSEELENNGEKIAGEKI